jgi:hypothetical protein
MELTGTVNVHMIPVLRSTSSQDTGTMDTACNRMGVANRTTALSKMDMGNKLDTVNSITFNKMGTTAEWV